MPSSLHFRLPNRAFLRPNETRMKRRSDANQAVDPARASEPREEAYICHSLQKSSPVALRASPSVPRRSFLLCGRRSTPPCQRVRAINLVREKKPKTNENKATMKKKQKKTLLFFRRPKREWCLFWLRNCTFPFFVVLSQMPVQCCEIKGFTSTGLAPVLFSQKNKTWARGRKENGLASRYRWQIG